ncbi:MAG: sigma 54-interacting transcriptional regulator [Trueperaceae bacterium]|nr:sigma 54-interacting transcriptional regulator [Trueperaceae bacterium]MCO5173954.1 sigma 54-interacting transcriptional regulator [Trueperaceae bacterium]MCW5820656.1 sigma 54-interacting transcriptional regulator [Trueperaceae bacterium]
MTISRAARSASSTHKERPKTLGELRGTRWEASAGRSVRDEIRSNLVVALQRRDPLFHGVVGYGETVVPAVVNALLSRHNFILLGLRGQAKTRILRQLVTLLDEEVPYLEGTELHDDPFAPLTAEGRGLVAELGEEAPIGWLPREQRYVEKLATPDTTVADIVGDIDPIKAARLGTRLGDERAVHFGLLPRANRGIFAINELPDLAGKVQVALFNVMQEGDVQIKGYPMRLPLDVLLVFSANPEDYTARGKIITPLKDRIGSEVRTHYPQRVEEGMAITRQEAWTDRAEGVFVPAFVAEAVEEVAFQARSDARVDKHSGVSQRLPISLLENVVSNAERRALAHGGQGVARISDLYAALPAVTGKIELEYEGELKGAESVAREIVRRAIGQVFGRRGSELDTATIVEYFDAGNSLRLPGDLPSSDWRAPLAEVPDLLTVAAELAAATSRDAGGVETAVSDELPLVSAEFILEGLYARRQIGRSEELGYTAGEAAQPGSRPRWN